jgi:hypothetical protein
VYVWVSGFASDDTGPEQASATAEGASVGGDDVNWIRVSLTRGENAPYDEGEVSYTVLDQDGASFTANKTSGDSDDVLCEAAAASSSSNVDFCDTNAFHDGTSSTWDVGEVLYVPCQGDGDHSVTISIKETTVLDSTIDCDAKATA